MPPSVFITIYAVQADADEAFLAAHDVGATTLLRALRDDVAYRFVAVARDEAPALVPPEGRFEAHPGRYEVVHEDGALDGAGGVILINPFKVPDDADDAFLDGWHPARVFLTGQPGYLGTRLHRSLGAADFRFVNFARWSSPLAFTRAVGQEEFRRVSGLSAFPSHPALYEIVCG
jgi:hypothetical protein